MLRRWSRERGNYRLRRRSRDRWADEPMTVGIAALCDMDGKTQTGKIIIASDMLVSFFDESAPTSSNKCGSKMYDLPHGFFSLIAGNVSKAHEFIDHLHGLMEHIDRSALNFVELVKLAFEHSLSYVRLWTGRKSSPSRM